VRLEPIATLEQARPTWEALEQQAGSIFSTWEWARAWWDAVGGDGELVLRQAVDGDGAPFALLPFYRQRRGPLTVLRMLGHGVADELAPVAAADDAARVGAALALLAGSELPPHGLALVDRLRGDTPLSLALAGGAVRDEPSPVLPRDGRDGDAWLAGRSSNLRQQLRRRERRLVRDHGLRYRLATDPERLDDDLSTLIRLHEARWADGGSIAFAGARERFHRTFARRALERGWLRLWLAETDGGAIAAWYGFRFGDSEWYYQAGRDPRCDRTGVGSVLLAHTIRSAFDDGVETYRFGVGDESYKTRFADGDPRLRSVVMGRALPRQLALAASRLGQRLPADARHKLVRRAG